MRDRGYGSVSALTVDQLGLSLREASRVLFSLDARGVFESASDIFGRTSDAIAQLSGRAFGEVFRAHPFGTMLASALAGEDSAAEHVLGPQAAKLYLWPRRGADGAVSHIAGSLVAVGAPLPADGRQATEANYRALLDAMPELVMELDAEGRIVNVFGGLLRTLNQSPEYYVGRTFRELAVSPRLEIHEEHLQRALKGETCEYAWSMPGPLGTRHFLTKFSPVPSPDGVIRRVLGLGQDITERTRSEQALLNHKDVLDAVLRAAGDLGEIILLSQDPSQNAWAPGRVFHCAGLSAITGYDDAELTSMQHLIAVIAPEDREEVLTRIQRLRLSSSDRFETTIIAKDGRRVRIEVAVKTYRAGARRGVVVFGRDITDRVRVQEELERRAFFDAVTGLPNRHLLQDRLRQALANSQRASLPVSVLVMDLDRFKQVNDALGHAAGDALLRAVGERLTLLVRGGDTIARLGGDEFAFILPGATAVDAAAFAVRIRRTMEEAFQIEGQLIDVRASVGIAAAPDHASTTENLLKRADFAMYTAKRAGGGHAVYAHDAERSSNTQRSLLSLTTDLRTALLEDSLAVVFQPQVSLVSRQIVGVEALARWMHPTHGPLEPAVFIPLAEETGLIGHLTKWVIERAIKESALLRSGGLNLPVAVNISMRNLLDPDLPDLVAGILDECGVPPEMLELEITETAVMSEVGKTLRLLERLHEVGVRLAIDDFGTGYSSLSYLHQLPLDSLKIDKSFVVSMARQQRSASIVRSTIELAHNLGLTVVAEGVEDPASFGLLARLGCDVAQGFYMSEPRDIEDLMRWITTQQAEQAQSIPG